ncbi:hypothetical protein [Fodinicola feengrottensis]|uniref:hypothetical protein n=1 Tax=Fodinicola feengrottensis TaxID=435914 RepID=UPI002442510B|nr:hypothetical protein [Fodinicola feengrottensis]
MLVQTFPKIVDASLGSSNDENLRDLFDEQVRAYMTGSKTATQALTDAAAQWNSALAKTT